MATTSLGRLTLDLAVRLSEFTDGLTQAERQARDSTDNIGGSVRNMRDNITDDISKISGSFAGMAIGGAAVAASAMAAMAIEAAKADVQLSIMAGTANTSLKNFQVLTYAASNLGVEQDALAGILADVQEKLGEFSATGGGGAADFFEALQNNTKMTDEQIRKLGKTLQGKDGVEAVQLIKDRLDDLGATSQEQRFVFESLAGDLGNLMGLFSNGGEILDEYGVHLTDAGVIKTEEAMEESKKLAAQTQAIQTKMEGLKTQLVTYMIPALGTLIEHFTEGKTEGGKFKEEVSDIEGAINSTAAVVVGLAAGVGIFSTALQQFSIQAGSLGQTVTDFFEADGFREKGAALAAGMTRQAAAGVAGYMTIANQYQSSVDTINTLMDGQQQKLRGLAGTIDDTSTAMDEYNEGLETNTEEAEANAKAKDKQAAAEKKLAEERAKAAAQQARLVGISGDTGIGSAHLHVQYRDKSRPVSAADLGRFQAGGKNISDYKKTSGYGPRNTGIKGASTYHRGTDFRVPKNTPITTSVPVKNVKTWLDKKGGGYVSTITFGDGVVIDLLHQMPGIMGIEKGETTGNNQIDGAIKRADAMWQKSAADAGRAQEKAAADALRAKEDQERKQLSIVNQYATTKEKIELDHVKNVEEIKGAYAKGSAEYVKYMAREEAEYEEKKSASLLSITEKYFSEEQRIHDNHQKALKEIELANIQDDDARQMFIDMQNAAYQEDLDNFKFASQAKAREQDKLYQSIANSMKSNRGFAASEGLDRMAQRTMGDDEYSVWRLAQDRDETSDSVNTQYQDRQNQINARDERGNFELPELERFELLEAAKQEHLDNMWAMEQDHALKQQTLDEQLKNSRIAIQENAFGAMTSIAGTFFGKNSKMQQAAFIMERTYATQKALMNVKETYSNTFNAISAIPLIGPYIAMPMATAASAIQVAQAAGIGSISAPSISGIAHGGLDYVPKESTYLLDEGERVLSPRQNKDLANFMANGQKASYGGITINESPGAQASVRREPNGGVTVDMVDKMIEKSFRRIGRANSIESKSIQRGTTARVNRR